MGFFKDLKEDFSQAVNGLLPGDDDLGKDGDEDSLVADSKDIKEDSVAASAGDSEEKVVSESSKLDGLLEQVTRQEEEKAAAKKAASDAAKASPSEQTAEPASTENKETQKTTIPGGEKMSDQTTTPITSAMGMAPAGDAEISDEVSVITEGTVIKGDILTKGSLDVRGQVNGNVGCNGKLVVTGIINGNSSASEIFADAARIEGEVMSSGTVKIGAGAVIIGNVVSTSAVVAGAIKGDIDVQGPVVIDTSAVVMGNIKSRSVQINNGAVIEGFCSQCYSDVDLQSLFEEKKGM